MPEVIDFTKWSALMLGLLMLFAAIGALRKPGIWQAMISEIEKSPALQLISGLAELTIGTMIYLANPWMPQDLLACVMKGVAGLMMLEALMVLGFSDLYFHFWLKNLSFMHRGWSIVTFIAGIALTAAAMLRLS